MLSSASNSGIEQVINMDIEEFSLWLKISKGVRKKCQCFL